MNLPNLEVMVTHIIPRDPHARRIIISDRTSWVGAVTVIAAIIIIVLLVILL
jgi:hypothetical protein